MKRSTALLLALLPAAALHAQEGPDSSRALAQQPGIAYRPLYTLVRADIKRIPAGNFMELVNGAFPFLASDRVRSQDYSFVVDGHLVADPQLLNPAQIARIDFYPQGTQLLNGQGIRRGTFVIRSTVAEKGIRFYAHGGSLQPGSEVATVPHLVSPITEPAHSRSYAQGEVAAGLAIGRGRLSSDFQYTHGGTPTYTYQRNWANEAGTSQLDRYRLTNFFELPLGKHFQLQAALLGALQGQTDSLTVTGEHVTRPQAGKDPRKAWSLEAAAGLQFNSGRWHNGFNATWSGARHANDRYVQTYNWNGAPYSYETYYDARRQRNWTLRNTTSFDIVRNKSLRLEASLQLYYRETRRTDTVFGSRMDQSGVFGNVYSRFVRQADNNLQVTPGLLLDLHSVLQFELHATHDRIEGDLTGLDKKSEDLFPQTALRFNAAPLLPGRVLSRLETGVDYRKRRVEEARPSLLDERPQSISEGGLPYPFEAPQASTWTAHLQAGFFQDRLLLSFQYIQSTEQRQFTGQSSGWSGFTSTSMWREFSRRAVGLQLRGEVLRKKDLSWVLQGTAYRDDYDFDDQGINRYVTVPVDPNIDLFDKTILRSGLQTWFRYKGIHLQAAALGTVNDHAVEDFNNGAQGYFNQWRLTQLVAGYTFGFRKGALASLELNGHLRNLPITKATPNSLYRFPSVGAGVLVKLR